MESATVKHYQIITTPERIRLLEQILHEYAGNLLFNLDYRQRQSEQLRVSVIADLPSVQALLHYLAQRIAEDEQTKAELTALLLAVRQRTVTEL